MERIRLGDACDILNGFAFKSDKYVEDGIRIIRIANVQKGYIEENAPAFYPIDSVGLEKYMLEEGDLLMSLTGNVGRVALLQKEMLPAALNQRVACLRLKVDRITKGFLFHILNSDFFEQQCVQASNGVAQKNISTEWLKDYEIPLYSIEEQLKITDILDKVRRIIISRNDELSALDDLIKARFVELFDSDIRKSNMTISDVAEETTVGIANSATHAYTDSGVVMLRNQNIRVNYLDDSDLIFIKKEFAEKYKNKALRENDILVTRTGANVGMACVVPKKYAGCQTFTTLILRLRKDICISPVFVCHYINSPIGKAFVEENKIGGGQPNFGAKQLATMPIVIPDKKKQDDFDLFVKQIDKSKVAVQKALTETQLLFDSLMQQYFG